MKIYVQAILESQSSKNNRGYCYLNLSMTRHLYGNRFAENGFLYGSIA